MKRRAMIIIVLIVLAVVISSVLIIALSPVFKRAPFNGKIYIRSDGTVDPPTAQILQDRNVYTFAADIQTESVVVQRNNTVIDGNGCILQGNGTGYGIYSHETKNITVKNTRIMGFSAGIRLSFSPESTLVNNTIRICVYGVISSDSPNTTVSNNTITDNEWDGIFITGSDGSIVSNNTVANHDKWGIYLGYSAGSVFRNNVLTDNRWNFGVSVEFIHNIDTSNTVDGKPIYYWINQSNKQVPVNAGYVALISSTNITVRDLSLNNNGQGVMLVNSQNCLIENSSLTNNGYYAIQLVESNDNTISNNTIANNDFGVACQYSTGNFISGNLIEDNQRGIHLQDSNGNIIYHNNFVNNTRQASSERSTNAWDDGYPSGGNYWSDYSGEDANADGIGDTPHIIDTDNRDNYPLMSLWTPKIAVNIDINFRTHRALRLFSAF